MSMLFFLIIFLYSVILHEIAHGYVAYLLGDDTAYSQGRLSLNPVYHIDPFGSVILPLVLFVSRSPVIFGYARPVPVNPLKFSKVKNMRLGMALCSAAGPLTNLILAYIFCIMAKFSINSGAVDFFMGLSVMNIVLGLFNLLPIPGLDGSHLISVVLPRDLLLVYKRLEPYAMIIIFLLAVSGLLGMLLFPVMEVVVKWMC